MDIVVLAGGLSPERDVSLSSGALIANALMRRKHRVLLLDLYLGLPQATDFNGAHQILGKVEYCYRVAQEQPDLQALQAQTGRDALIGENVLAICKDADLTFLALHGSIGENGQLQAIFDAYGITYTGTGYTGSLLAMHKAIAKELMVQHGVPTPAWTVCRPGDAVTPPFMPCVIKPMSCGSSVGISLVDTPDGFAAAIAEAALYEDEILIEEKITGREFSIGILEGRALPVIEILPKEGFYDYKNKYQAGLTTELCPAPLDAATAEMLQSHALAAHKALRLGDYSRVDFLLDGQGNAFCLEANTLPGMTPTSLLPQEAAVAGIPYDDLCERLALLALR